MGFKNPVGCYPLDLSLIILEMGLGYALIHPWY